VLQAREDLLFAKIDVLQSELQFAVSCFSAFPAIIGPGQTILAAPDVTNPLWVTILDPLCLSPSVKTTRVFHLA